MKLLTISIALVGAMATASAFAQSQLSDAQTASAPTQTASSTLKTVAPGGEYVPPYGQAVVGKTRAQVYQELEDAEKDGEIAQLNATVYKGS
jgi:hypothetical protein